MRGAIRLRRGLTTIEKADALSTIRPVLEAQPEPRTLVINPRVRLVAGSYGCAGLVIEQDDGGLLVASLEIEGWPGYVPARPLEAASIQTITDGALDDIGEALKWIRQAPHTERAVRRMFDERRAVRSRLERVEAVLNTLDAAATDAKSGYWSYLPNKIESVDGYAILYA